MSDEAQKPRPSGWGAVTAPGTDNAGPQDAEIALRVANALDTFQKRNGYHKAVIVELLEDFGGILAAPILAENAALRLSLETVTRERDEARDAVALCNNSFGSWSYHLEPHPAEKIEDIKKQAGDEWKRANAAEARATAAEARVRELEAGLTEIERLEPATTEMTVAHEMGAIARSLLTKDNSDVD